MTVSLRSLAQRSSGSAPADGESCDLCGGPIPEHHRHVLDLDSGEPQCACRACAVLFDRDGAGGGHYRLIPERRVSLDGFRVADRLFAALGIPVDLAFIHLDSQSDRAVARYPSAVGLIAALPAPDAWEELTAANPELRDLEPDVEALLANHARGASEHWIVPIDDCYRLAARIRETWSGFSGGDEVWHQIDGFFEELRSERKEATWR